MASPKQLVVLYMYVWIHVLDVNLMERLGANWMEVKIASLHCQSREME